MVNNAGISAVGTVEDLSDEDWSRVLDVNVVGIARVSAAAMPHLRDSDAAAIVNTCSIAALNGLPQRALYAASKGAVLALTFAMATDHVAEGIRVNCVCPGTVHTGFVDRLLATFPDPEKETRRDGRAPGHRPDGDARGGRVRGRLPGQPARRLDHRDRARRRRRRHPPARPCGAEA